MVLLLSYPNSTNTGLTNLSKTRHELAPMVLSPLAYERGTLTLSPRRPYCLVWCMKSFECILH
nr:hypothetical protein Q903MT_gene6553 [Picea sitchensis]